MKTRDKTMLKIYNNFLSLVKTGLNCKLSKNYFFVRRNDYGFSSENPTTTGEIHFNFKWNFPMCSVLNSLNKIRSLSLHSFFQVLSYSYFKMSLICFNKPYQSFKWILKLFSLPRVNTETVLTSFVSEKHHNLSCHLLDIVMNIKENTFQMLLSLQDIGDYRSG